MTGPPERKSPAFRQGSDQLGGDRSFAYTTRRDKQTAVFKRVSKLLLSLGAGDRAFDIAHQIAFWGDGDFTLPTSWMPQPGEAGGCCVWHGPVPEWGRFREAVWVWLPSGYQCPIAIAGPLFSGSAMAETLASCLPGAKVIDARPIRREAVS